MGKLKRVLIMAGGTGGHIFPGLAVAKLLREKGVDVHWLGIEKGLEAQVVAQAGFPLHFISIGGLRGKGLKDLLWAPWRLLIAIMQSMRIIYKLKPDVVLGMGGFVSGPGGVVSWLLRRPLIIHEQNAKAGLTNKWLACLASKIAEGFPNTFTRHRERVVTTGNPLRAEIAALANPSARIAQATSPHLLVLGGSLGAAAINQLAPRVFAKLPHAIRPEIRHQTGEKHWQATLKAYQNADVSADIVPFISEMHKAYQWADIVLCRAGALTIAELCAAGLGAILVPFPHAVDDHQTANAKYMVKNNAALLIQQIDLTEEKLIEIIKQLSTEKRVAMSKAAYELRQVDATEKVVQLCEEICQ